MDGKPSMVRQASPKEMVLLAHAIEAINGLLDQAGKASGSSQIRTILANIVAGRIVGAGGLNPSLCIDMLDCFRDVIAEMIAANIRDAANIEEADDIPVPQAQPDLSVVPNNWQRDAHGRIIDILNEGLEDHPMLDVIVVIGTSLTAFTCACADGESAAAHKICDIIAGSIRAGLKAAFPEGVPDARFS